MADYFPFYTSFKQAASTLPDDKRLQLYDIVTDYGNLGIEPPLEVDPVVMGMFSLIKPSIDSAKKNQRSGSSGGRGNKKPVVYEEKSGGLENEKPVVCDFQKHNSNSESKSKSNSESKGKGESDSEGEKKNMRFAPPTLAEIKAYIAEKGFCVDAERFLDYYTANGWMVGKNKMKDWKAAVRNWERQDKNTGGKGGKTHEEIVRDAQGKWGTIGDWY